MRLSPIEAKVTELRQACRQAGIAVTPDGYIGEVGAASLLGLQPKTLTNWRSAGVPLDYRRVAGRVWYPLSAVAERLVNGTSSAI